MGDEKTVAAVRIAELSVIPMVSDTANESSGESSPLMRMASSVFSPEMMEHRMWGDVMALRNERLNLIAESSRLKSQLDEAMQQIGRLTEYVHTLEVMVAVVE